MCLSVGLSIYRFWRFLRLLRMCVCCMFAAMNQKQGSCVVVSTICFGFTIGNLTDFVIDFEALCSDGVTNRDGESKPRYWNEMLSENEQVFGFILVGFLVNYVFHLRGLLKVMTFVFVLLKLRLSLIWFAVGSSFHL